MTTDEIDPVGALLEEFTAAVRRGEPADVESWAARHPDQAEAIRELFPTVLAIEGLREPSERPAPGAHIGVGVIDRLGDFRIVQEIGRGGMGVVYEAEQESLDRRVAVKVLPPLRDPKRIHRFEREARTAARLHHTNIVPIFGVGEHEGWHYYVMQVIRGVGLDAVLRTLRSEGGDRGRPGGSTGLTPEDAVRMLRSGAFRTGSLAPSSDRAGSSASEAGGAPSAGGRASRPGPAAAPAPADPGQPSTPRAPYWRSVAEIGRQIADALAYAHGQGVLHRDVKPGNLLLDAHGVVWVTDFGLAKAIGHEGLTMSGDLVGTLQYMAPEQLHGRYDARTDVYGLGLTLYELLTLRPAFADGDRGGLVRKIEQGNPTPPGQVRPGIPHDLETVVLKAIQHDPRHRYQTAAELAEDLQRYLEDRPIRARRATASEQLWRWCRRNRAVAGLAAVAMLAVLVAAVVGWTGYVSTRRALAEAQREAERAGGNLELALQAFEDIFDQIAGADRIGLLVDDSGEEAAYEWYSQATVSGKDAALLERLLEFYDRFAAQNAGSADLRQDTAKAYRRVGFLLLQLRRVEDARRAYDRALELQQQIGADTEAHRVAIAAIRNDLGRVAMESDDPAAARGAFRTALELLESSASRGARFEQARALEHLGLLSFSRRRLPFDRERGSRAALPADRPGADDPDRGAPPWSEGLRSLREAHRLNRELADEQPDNPAFQVAAARSGRYVALALSPERPLPGEPLAELFENLPIVTDTVARLRALCERHPEVESYRGELARTYLEFAARMRTILRPRSWRDPDRDLRRAPPVSYRDSAGAFVAEALRLAEDLHRDRPGSADHARLLADGLELRARIELSRSHAEDPATSIAPAIEALRRAIEVRPTADSPRDALQAADDRVDLAIAIAEAGDPGAALQEVDRAIAELDALRAARPDFDGYRQRLAETLRAKAGIAESAGSVELAVAALLRSIELQLAREDRVSRLLTVTDVVDLARLEVLSGDVTGALRRTDLLLRTIVEQVPRPGSGPDPIGRGRLERILRRAFEPLLRTLREQGFDEQAETLEARLRDLGRG
jgi:tetratricopeptide (TPR) repeat protein